MASPTDAAATQLRNIVVKTGKSVAEWRAAIAATGLAKHGEIRSWIAEQSGLGHGDANALAHAASTTETPPGADPLGAIYAGNKAHLRPIHEALITAIAGWGDYELALKKANASFRRKKQFALLGPKNASTAELGINAKDDLASDRIIAQKPGGMCQFAVALTTPDDLDAPILAALRHAFDAAG